MKEESVMVKLSMNLIDESGNIAFQDNFKTIYLTPEAPLTYYSNKWPIMKCLILSNG